MALRLLPAACLLSVGLSAPAPGESVSISAEDGNTTPSAATPGMNVSLPAEDKNDTLSTAAPGKNLRGSRHQHCDETMRGWKDEGYRGCQTKTVSGRTCQRWDSRSPHSHDRTPWNYPSDGLVGNYCRNPDGEPTIWCYTTDPRKRWEFCQPLTSPCEREELSGWRGNGYRGCQDETLSGKRCQAWASQTPNRHDRTPANYPGHDLVENRCRNPDGEATIWCYTATGSPRWEYCEPKVPGGCDEHLWGNGAWYQGCQTRTRSGKTCQAWASQSPHRHSNSMWQKPLSGLKRNYCRNPDGEPTIWCYTTDPHKRWDFCDPL